MRLACLHLPGFPLQVAVRDRPELAGRAVAAVDATRAPRVVSLSRAALERGVRRGMATGQARLLAPDLELVGAGRDRLRAALRALAEEIAQFSPTLELGGDGPEPRWDIWLEVPPAQRPRRFARRLVAAARRAGYRARVGVAEDRFTAWAAAVCAGDDPVHVVPRGGAAAFLAPLPLELLPLADEVRHMLRAAGVTTLGAFAALPPPSVRPPGALDVHEMARGRGPTGLRPTVSIAPHAPSARQGARRARTPSLPFYLAGDAPVATS